MSHTDKDDYVEIEDKFDDESEDSSEYDDILEEEDDSNDENEDENEDNDDESSQEEEGTISLDSLDRDDPIGGPVYNFITELLENASLPVDANNIRIILDIDHEDGEETREQISSLRLSSTQRISVLKANIDQLIQIMAQQEIDFDQVCDIRKNYGDEDGFVVIDEEVNEIPGNAVDYLDYIQRIIQGAKALAKEDQTGVIELLTKLILFARKHDSFDLYKDISNCGRISFLKATWNTIPQ